MSSSLLFFCLLLILALFLFRKPKKLVEPHIKKRPSPAKSVSLPKKVRPAQKPTHMSSRYEVERKQTNPFLKKGWNKKSSLKQAYIVSEVLKKWDESERKF